MAGNSFGTLFKIHTFGESHGEAIGVVIDGCPAGLNIDMDFLQSELDRRKPGQSNITSPRKESDEAKIISGVFNGQTMGTPICIMIANENPKEKDYILWFFILLPQQVQSYILFSEYHVLFFLPWH